MSRCTSALSTPSASAIWGSVAPPLYSSRALYRRISAAALRCPDGALFGFTPLRLAIRPSPFINLRYSTQPESDILVLGHPFWILDTKQPPVSLQ